MGHHLMFRRHGIAQAGAPWSQNFLLSHLGNPLLPKDHHLIIISSLRIAGIPETQFSQRMCSVRLRTERLKIRVDRCGSNHRKRNLGMLQIEISGVTSPRRLNSKVSTITIFAEALQEKFVKHFIKSASVRYL